jgi:hypothetical protein
MKPMFKKVDNHIYKSEYHPDVIANKDEGQKAIYHVKGNKVYASAAHPDGPTPHALFTINGGLIHTTIDHPEHQSGLPVFKLDHRPDAEFIKKTVAAEAPPPPPKPASSPTPPHSPPPKNG